MKKRIVALSMLIILLVSLTGCGSLSNREINKTELEEAGFVYIGPLGESTVSDLYYYKDTRVVYISICGSISSGFCPYISEEGTYVRYEDATFVNIEQPVE